MSKTRGLIIGFGNMGELHLARYQTLGVEIVGIVDNDNEKRFKIFENNIMAYPSLDKFLESNHEAVDFIDICLPTHSHFSAIKEVTEKFAKHPVPICVEKPVVRTEAESIELEALAKQYGAMIFVAECEQYNMPLMTFLRSVPDIDYIEITRMVNLKYFTLDKNTWLLDDAKSGGLILDLMIHDLTLLCLLGGKASKIVNVNCAQKKSNYIDQATIRLNFKNFSAKITGSWLSEDILHPIITTVITTDKNGIKQTLKVKDYLQPKSKDPYLVELAVFIDAVQKKSKPQRLSTYTRAVRLANRAISLASQCKLDMQSELQASLLSLKLH